MPNCVDPRTPSERPLSDLNLQDVWIEIRWYFQGAFVNTYRKSIPDIRIVSLCNQEICFRNLISY